MEMEAPPSTAAATTTTTHNRRHQLKQQIDEKSTVPSSNYQRTSLIPAASSNLRQLRHSP
ncbi:hypothetical protein H5410_012100 [Solanum commersonii]|uniref:Uncharacterized protein n=1 Tax=Solanum commersonii TaxID=4109 RepID=A0A9J6ARP6_SOLCO|nr:hypothetical protein H5410_012100 [Solanum commersonii]